MCSFCGQRHEGRCLFDPNVAYMLKGFLLTCYVTLSRFNRYYTIFLSKEAYDSFAIFASLPNSEDLEKMYGEPFEDLILLSISNNTEEDKVFNFLFIGSPELEIDKVDDFNLLRQDKSEYRQLDIAEIKKRNGKLLFQTMEGNFNES